MYAQGPARGALPFRASGTATAHDRGRENVSGVPMWKGGSRGVLCVSETACAIQFMWKTDSRRKLD
jgi:hypothetical protein